MSSLFENGSIIGQTLDYRSTVVTTIEDEVNSPANVEVVETKSISFGSLTSGVDVSSTNSLTLSSTLEEGDIIVVQTFMDTGNATDVSDSGSSWVELIGTGNGTTNISNINTQLVYKVVASGNETTDKTVSWSLPDSRGGAIVVLVRDGTATGLQSNYDNTNNANQLNFPALSGATSNSVALLFSALDDQVYETISSFPSNYTTAEDFSAGSGPSSGLGIKGYAGYREGVTSTENGEGTKSITYSLSDSIVNVSVLIPRNIATKTAKTNSGVWDTESVYNDISFDAAAATFEGLTVLDDYYNYDSSSTASRSVDISGEAGFNEVILFTVSVRYAYFGTPVADVNSSATNYTVIDTVNSGTFSAFGGTVIIDAEIAVVTGSSSVTAEINNSGGSFTVVNRFGAVAFEGLTSSATIHDSAVVFSGASTITDTINVVAGGLLIIIAADGSSQTITETTSLLGTITEATNNQDADQKIYTAKVNTTGTATIQSVQDVGNNFESLAMYSISP